MLDNRNTLDTDWVSPPGSTIEDLIFENGDSIENFSSKLNCNPRFLNRLIKGKEPVDKELAMKLQNATGASSEFWLNRELQYRESIDRLIERNSVEETWLSSLPTADMAKNGWIEKITKKSEKLLACLDFFDVLSVDEWQSKYEAMLAETAFRTSPTFSSKSESISVWLRMGELVASEIDCEPWDKNRLVSSIDELRELTRIKQPSVFLPEVRNILRRCGVAFAVVKAPEGCRASGATYWLNKEKALVILSCRYLSDDHFWFTFFHELGHLILHSDHHLILESKDSVDSKIEEEANRFSELVLVPEEYQSELATLNARNLRRILKFAKKIGVSNGIVVGQMQHKGLISNRYLNKLKTRFSW